MTTVDRDTNQAERVNRLGFVRLVLTNLFETIVDTDDRNQRPRTRTGNAQSGNSQFDYRFGIGPQSAEPERGNTPETLSASASTDHAATIRSIDGEYVITLDLSVADPTELSADVDSDARDRTQWRGRIACSSSSRRPQSWDISSNNAILGGRLYRRIAK